MSANEHLSNSNHIRVVGALAGVGSGLTKVTVGHGSAYRRQRLTCTRISFDTIKTRLQCAPDAYRGAFDAFFKIVRNEGPLALYKGATPPAVGWAAIDSLLLGSLHNYRLFLIRHGMTEPTPGTGIPRLTLFGHGIAGLFAGVTSTILATPIEHIKVKLQLQSQRLASERQFRGPIDCVRKVYRVQGPLGLWAGLTGSIAFRSNFFWMFLSFEALMRTFTSPNGVFQMSTGAANFLSGGLGSFAFWMMAIPADNVKNRMMAFPYPSPFPSSPAELGSKPSFLRTVRTIHAQDGAAGFFRGLGPCLLRAFPVNACAFFVYEGLMRVLGAEKTRHS